MTLTTVAMLAAAGCSHTDEPVLGPVNPPQTPSENPDAPLRLVNLHIDLNVVGSVGEARQADHNRSGDTPSGSYDGTRADYDGSPESDDELLHSVRIIILDGEGHVEHNTLWDLTSDPAVLASGKSFPVKPNDSKTVILLGNERWCNVTDISTGETVSMGEYFSRLLPMYGDDRDVIDVEALKQNVTIGLSENRWSGSEGEELDRPLPATAIYEGIEITGVPDQSAKFWMHRAAVKFYFEIVNNSNKSRSFSGIWLENMAESEYLFYHAQFSDPITSAWDKGLSEYIEGTYSPFAAAGLKPVEIPIPEADRTVPARGTLKVGPIYLLEGCVNPAYTEFYRDTKRDGIGYRALLAESSTTAGGTGNGEYTLIKNSDGKAMTDLPRNHCIIVKGKYTPTEPKPLSFNYTVCEWEEYETDIPEYN